MAAKHSELFSNTELDWIHVDMADNELAGFSDGVNRRSRTATRELADRICDIQEGMCLSPPS